MPGRLYAGLCHAFLVLSLLRYVLPDIVSDYTAIAAGSVSQT